MPMPTDAKFTFSPASLFRAMTPLWLSRYAPDAGSYGKKGYLLNRRNR